MANEVFNQPGGNVSSRVQVQDVQNFTGALGRSTPGNPVASTLAGLSDVFTNVSAAQGRQRVADAAADKAAREQAVNVAAGDLLLEETNRTRQEGMIVLGDELSGKIKDFEQLPTDVQHSLTGLQQSESLLREAARQGGRQFELTSRLLGNVRRRQFIAANPGYAAEALQTAGMLNQNEQDASTIYRDIHQEQKRRDDLKSAQDKLLTDSFFDPLTMTPEQTTRALASVRARGLAIMDMDADIKASQASTASQVTKDRQRSELVTANLGAIQQQFIAGLNDARIRVVDRGFPATPQGVADSMRAYAIEAETAFRQSYGYRDTASFNADIGDTILKPAMQNIEDTLTGKVTVEQMTNNLKYQTQNATQELIDLTGGDILKIQALQQGLGPVLSGYATAEFTSAVRDVVVSAGYYAANKRTTDTFGKRTNSPADRAAIDSAVTNGSRILKEQGPAILKAPIDERAGFVGLYHSAMADIKANQNPKNVATAIEVFADPNYVKLADGIETPTAVTDTMSRTLRSMGTQSQAIVAAEADNLVTTVANDGTISLKLIRPTRNSAAVAKLQTDMNNWVKATAHLNHSTDYAAAAYNLLNGTD